MYLHFVVIVWNFERLGVTTRVKALNFLDAELTCFEEGNDQLL